MALVWTAVVALRPASSLYVRTIARFHTGSEIVRAGQPGALTTRRHRASVGLRPKAGMTAERPGASCQEASMKKGLAGETWFPPRCRR